MRRGYLELVRPANVVTALADVLAGFGVAGLAAPRALPGLLTATACLYAGGIVLNDVFDRGIDAVERPERPIPSGRVPVRRAAALGAGLLAGGVLAASVVNAMAALLAGAIVIAVLLYDTVTKRVPLVGPLNMGACRALNLLLGMAAVPSVVAGQWRLAIIPLVYITAVTLLSRGEVRGGSRTTAVAALLLVVTVLMGLAALALRPRAPSAAAVLLTGFLTWRVVPPFWRAFRQGGPASIRLAVRAGVLSLVLVDAVIGTAYAGMIYGLVILATAALAAGLARLFAVT